jgi:hypothetical protein
MSLCSCTKDSIDHVCGIEGSTVEERWKSCVLRREDKFKMESTNMNAIVRETEKTLEELKVLTPRMLKICILFLRNISNYRDRRILVQLKRELKDFNATTRTWRNE